MNNGNTDPDQGAQNMAGALDSSSLSKDQRSLREFQRQMLDLTLRNPLLNYRASKRFGLDIIDEEPAQIIAWFLEDGKSFKFHPTKRSRKKSSDRNGEEGSLVDEADESEGLIEIEDEVSEGEDAEEAANPEDSLATPYTPEVLYARLEQTSRNAKLFYQERGIGALYLTVGMLVWYEAIASEKRCEAPLILFPAQVDRKSSRALWRLELGSEDPGINISLAEKMKEFGLSLPTEWDLEDHTCALNYLEKVREIILHQPDRRWAVDDRRITLGFYSFARFLMWRDLSEDNWPKGRELLEHPVVQGMMGSGFREPANPLSDGYQDLDAEREKLGTFTEVVDIDSSQAETLAQVAAGRNAVVHGPPGTGKSQTITNMIVDAVGRGLRVLFVAEKMAALQVVARRMEVIGLDALCLELHSNKASKRALATEIHRTLELTEPDAPAGLDQAIVDARQLRGDLNDYCHAVANASGKAKISLTSAVGLIARSKRRCPSVPPCDVSALGQLSPEQRRILKNELEQLGISVRTIGRPSSHAFVGSRLEQVLPTDLPRIVEAARRFSVALGQFRQAARSLAEAMQVRIPDAAPAAGELIAFAELILMRPDGANGLSEDGSILDTDHIDQSVVMWLQLLRERDEIVKQYQGKVTGDLWLSNLKVARGELIATGDRFFLVRWFSRSFKDAVAMVKKLCEPPVPKRVDDLIKIAGAAIRVQEIVRILQSIEPKEFHGLGKVWKAEKTDHDKLESTLNWVRDSRKTLRSSQSKGPNWSRAAVCVNLEEVRSLVMPAQTAQREFQTAWESVVAILQMSKGLSVLSFGDLERRAARWEAEAGLAPDWAVYQRRCKPLRDRSLLNLLATIENGEVDSDELLPYVEGNWGEFLVAHALATQKAIAHFDVPTQELTKNRFVEADHQLLHQRRYEIARQHWVNLPKAVAHGRVGYVRKQLNPGRRQLPAIRSVMREAGEVIQQIKPVFLMSPLSIASYLPPGEIHFDLVIFDEASQIRPSDALGAIARATQVVIVGDPKQMPPTSFFDKMIAHDEGDDEEIDASVTDSKSILDLGLANGMPDMMLRWHYRSRHESLIALSNREFYHNRLLIFPSPNQKAGLSLVPVPEGVYDTGKSRTNVIEAKAVAEAALRNFRADPDTSLGLVALSTAQRNAIQTEVDLLRRQHPDFDVWCSRNDEAMFIKNLENVQGDERDIILISIGYGRVAPGGPVPLRFGPVNNEGGERRLNVLFTRSRKACKIFANFSADDLRLDASKSEGVRILRQFLKYAETGKLPDDIGPVVEDQTESPFEDEVLIALKGLGIEAHSQVGAGGYRIDFGIVDPLKPGRFILGVECDGASYHSSKWARDRDRLRQEVLESLGWRLHRIWSTDWFQDPDRALGRLAAAIAQARETEPQEFKRKPLGSVRRKNSGPANRTSMVPRYKEVRLNNNNSYNDVDQIPSDKLQAAIQYVIKYEAPILIDEVCVRIVRSVCDRATDRRKEVVRVAIDRLLKISAIRKDGEFLLGVNQPIVARDYTGREGISVDQIYCGEIDAALTQVVEESMGCTREEAVKQVCQLFGITGTSKNRGGIESRMSVLKLDVA